jgi:hypothetical protein
VGVRLSGSRDGAAQNFDANVGAAADVDAGPALSIKHVHSLHAEVAGSGRTHADNQNDGRAWAHDSALRRPQSDAWQRRRKLPLDADDPPARRMHECAHEHYARSWTDKPDRLDPDSTVWLQLAHANRERRPKTHRHPDGVPVRLQLTAPTRLRRSDRSNGQQGDAPNSD